MACEKPTPSRQPAITPAKSGTSALTSNTPTPKASATPRPTNLRAKPSPTPTPTKVQPKRPSNTPKPRSASTPILSSSSTPAEPAKIDPQDSSSGFKHLHSCAGILAENNALKSDLAELRVELSTERNLIFKIWQLGLDITVESVMKLLVITQDKAHVQKQLAKWDKASSDASLRLAGLKERENALKKQFVEGSAQRTRRSSLLRVEETQIAEQVDAIETHRANANVKLEKLEKDEASLWADLRDRVARDDQSQSSRRSQNLDVVGVGRSIHHSEEFIPEIEPSPSNSSSSTHPTDLGRDDDESNQGVHLHANHAVQTRDMNIILEGRESEESDKRPIQIPEIPEIPDLEPPPSRPSHLRPPSASRRLTDTSFVSEGEEYYSAASRVASGVSDQWSSIYSSSAACSSVLGPVTPLEIQQPISLPPFLIGEADSRSSYAGVVSEDFGYTKLYLDDDAQIGSGTMSRKSGRTVSQEICLSRPLPALPTSATEPNYRSSRIFETPPSPPSPNYPPSANVAEPVTKLTQAIGKNNVGPGNPSTPIPSGMTFSRFSLPPLSAARLGVKPTSKDLSHSHSQSQLHTPSFLTSSSSYAVVDDTHHLSGSDNSHSDNIARPRPQQSSIPVHSRFKKLGKMFSSSPVMSLGRSGSNENGPSLARPVSSLGLKFKTTPAIRVDVYARSETPVRRRVDGQDGLRQFGEEQDGSVLAPLRSLFAPRSRGHRAGSSDGVRPHSSLA